MAKSENLSGSKELTRYFIPQDFILVNEVLDLLYSSMILINQQLFPAH